MEVIPMLFELWNSVYDVLGALLPHIGDYVWNIKHVIDILLWLFGELVKAWRRIKRLLKKARQSEQDDNADDETREHPAEGKAAEKPQPESAKAPVDKPRLTA